MIENIFAYTGSGSYPEFISINGGENKYVVTVRCDDEKINHIDISLTKEQMLELANNIKEKIA